MSISPSKGAGELRKTSEAVKVEIGDEEGGNWDLKWDKELGPMGYETDERDYGMRWEKRAWFLG